MSLSEELDSLDTYVATVVTLVPDFLRFANINVESETILQKYLPKKAPFCGD